MAFHPTRPVVLRLFPAHGGGGGGHGGGGGFRGGGGGGFHGDGDGGDRPRGPHDWGPQRPPDPGPPPHTQDGIEGPFRVVRPADMLVVDISLVNLRLDGRRLVRRDAGAPAFVLAVLPPQHVVEQSFPADSAPPPEPIKAVTAGPTTLAFSVPDEPQGLDLSLAALLDWARLVPLTVPTGLSLPDTPGTTVFRDAPRSVLEFPTRLLLTYDDQVEWSSRPEPHQADGRAVLWHARLHGTGDGDVALRAFSTVQGRPRLPLDAPLGDDDMADLVTLTSRAELIPPGGPPLDVPSAPLKSEQFIVTPLGASARLHGVWDAPVDDEFRYQAAGRPFPRLEAYDHITGLGRDQYVRVVTRGHMCLGHRASHVHEYRRVFVASLADGIVAYVRREDRVIIKEPEVSYEQKDGYTHAGREMPFTSLRITDRVTPVIKPPDDPPSEPAFPGGPLRDQVAFWVRLLSDGSDYLFTVIGTDHEGRKVSFRMPLVFVPDGRLVDPEAMPGADGKKPFTDAETLLHRLYLEDKNRMRCKLDGQVMAMAQPPDDAPGSTSHAVGELTFGLGTFVPFNQAEQGRYSVGRPYVQEAQVRVEAVEQFTGITGDREVVFDDTYLERSMEAHPAGAYLNLREPVKLALGAEKAGGVASPQTALKLITAQAGVLPDAFTKDASGAIDLSGIKAAFAGAKLLGVIPLDRFLQVIPPDHHGTLQQLDDKQLEAVLQDAKGLLPAPVLRVRDLADGQGKELRYVWKTQLGKLGASAHPPENEPSMLPVDLEGATLTLDARTVRSPDAVAQATVQGSLTDFTLDFLKTAQVHFDKVEFRSGAGKKPDVTASGVELKFLESLEFINTLRSALPADVFGSGAYVDVDGKGIRAGYKFAVPSLGIGVFTLSNVSLAAELEIPFDEEKAVTFRFSVAERQHPFGVTVSLLGGGGYFSMVVDTNGPQQIEGAIEFGGAAALNLGVASGGVSIMAGIRFSLKKDKEVVNGQVQLVDVVSLSGYLRCSGFLCVLGLITVSVEFYLELTYVKHGRQSVVYGRGTLTVSVRIAFFSKSVTLELERSFSGAPCDPDFRTCVPLEPSWREYCEAYAPQPHG
ncbi:hypothetical protein GCM10010260_59910 [Streptomyces filipinensis]|uniref:Uncharacterized protein n=1 Tax=Streptomyces filipinensis TaxID=66887 RepID=A0A918IFZ3_9ACTN|nr:hypothetical protein [Streptomyces filipinensis]GGV13022.1 hypothetical protein GCM10010260_59910 [Streptomyces filipinensis]